MRYFDRIILSCSIIVLLHVALTGCDCKHAKEYDRYDRSASISSPVTTQEDNYIVPYLLNAGIPLLSYRWVTPRYEQYNNKYDINKPFKAPYHLRVAIWENGTIIWDESVTPRTHEYMRAKLSIADINKLLNNINVNNITSTNNNKHSEEVRNDGEMIYSVIAVYEGNAYVSLCSYYDQMESVEEYFYIGNTGIKTYPFNRYTFNEYLSYVPESYSEYLREYICLRDLVISSIPKNGKKVDLDELVLWVKLPVGVPVQRDLTADQKEGN